MLRPFETLRRSAAAGAVFATEEGSAMLEGAGPHSRPWHWHDCMMVLLPTTGALLLRDEDRPLGTWITKDRFAIVPAGRAHETEAVRENHTHLAFYVTDLALNRMETDLSSLARVRHPQKASSVFSTTPEIGLLRNLCGTHVFTASLARSNLAAALLVGCLGRAGNSDALSSSSPNSHGEMLVAEIRAFIRAHAMQEISIDLLAEKFDISRRHVTRLFREHAGCSIGEFQQAQKMETASRLLAETDLPIGEIALRVGFESGAALARALRRSHGQSPSAYRSTMARSDKS
jgi:AraC family transcriptional regulator